MSESGGRWGVSLLALAALLCGCEKTSPPAGRESGEALFLRYCAPCHPNGSNLLYPQKNLLRLTLAANGITTPDDIVARMRHPGPRMKRFDVREVSDADARKIATYILATFR